MSMSTTQFTVGIEEEFQTVDTRTNELHSGASAIQERAVPALKKNLQSELVQSMIELTTDVCPSIAVARQQVYSRRAQLAKLAAAEGLALISAGTHPSSAWYSQEKTPKIRYIELEEEFQDVVRMRVIFGLHIHIGIESQEIAIILMNQLRTWLPHLLALSANSPFWLGRFTGVKSYRSIIWQSGSPRNGLPEVIPTLADFNRYVQNLVNMQVIGSSKDLWWDIRPHPLYPTIEFRICDMPATVEDTLAIAALCQALVATLYWRHKHGHDMPSLPRDYIAENKWRAARYGLDGTFVDFVRMRTLPMRDALRELLDFIYESARDLDCAREIDFLYNALDSSEGTGADRQIAVYKRTGDLHQVTRLLIEQTMLNVLENEAKSICTMEAK
ncbi:MAG: carboxylate-amine ligase [Ktedonobacteraceae bacterium]|nr:carboxylate-amine ligase [Ktedonobacteraceae bacterium]MBV9713449.1 carboxylate-amine ligase [Ktedonobacteraceae bacterium]